MPDHIVFNVRCILLFQTMLIALTPECQIRIRQEVLILWKKMKAILLTPRVIGKRSRFWEIDMTKFEP